jgi:hypothetical protein
MTILLKWCRRSKAFLKNFILFSLGEAKFGRIPHTTLAASAESDFFF